ncbi:Metallo-dependent hydrolase [Wilcoxina mikolae CBS 423.85]|nr:Metallo-dependent hydrolase [Wilcoxina mikolae CBS 423.85]
MPLHFPQPHNPASPSTPRKLAIIGTFIDAPAAGEIRVRSDTVVVVDVVSGTIESIITPQQAQAREQKRNIWECNGSSDDIKIIDLRANAARVIVPGFVDCHVHAPQWLQLGTKTDVPLMEWLYKYTFPSEAEFASPAYARKIYTQVVRRLLRNGTTTALYFASNHLEASLILADICGSYGQRALVGKTCSDQLVPDYYVETTQGSLRDTEAFIVGLREKFGDEGALVMPVVTPRFVPTCSRELLKGLGVLAKKYNCHIQTHAAESVDQVALVRSQYPDMRRDITILSSFNLLTDKTILAHCTHLHDSEATTLAKIGSSIVSCPCSNVLMARAVLPVNRFRALGVEIGLGTDIAGGWSVSMVDSMRMATLGDEERISYDTAFYMATRGGALALKLENVGAFEVGMQWDAVEVDLTWDEDDLNFEDGVKFERWVCGHGGERGVQGVWVGGKQVFVRTEAYGTNLRPRL